MPSLCIWHDVYDNTRVLYETFGKLLHVLLDVLITLESSSFTLCIARVPLHAMRLSYRWCV
jgi:hypothetical protein